MKRLGALAGLAGFVLVLFLLMRYDAHRLDNLSIALMQVYRACSHYVQDHTGKLPASIDELVEQGYIRKVARDGREAYLGPSARRREFIPVYDRSPIPLEAFRIGVAGNVGQLEVRAGRAYRTGGDVPVAIVVPSRSALMELSLELTAETVRTAEQYRDETSRPDEDIAGSEP